mmetsp:Transcript_12131/g.18618  ORF Transcript_12131/g.18618 Transcript_12131/m.18618 type:complete len:361 (-) Transcript_12131:241-1323(-)
MQSLLILLSFLVIDLTLAKHLRILQGTECTGQQTVHETTLSLNFHGDPDALTDDDIATITNAIEESYQGLHSDPCFDIVEIVSADDTSRRRELVDYGMNQRGLNDGQVQFDFNFVFFVTFQCNGCIGDSSLNNDGSRRLNDGRVLGNKRTQRDAFVQKFNRILNKSEVVSKVDRLNRVSEEKQVGDCSAATTKRVSTNLSITLKGDSKYLLEDEAEMDNLERGVEKAYNTMNQANPYTCDTSFRKIDRVEFRTLAPVADDVFIVTFVVRYECHGCENRRKDPLFGEQVSIFDAGRQDLYVDFQESDVVSPDCYCDIQADVDRPPTADEFARALKKLIVIRTDQGKITAVTNVATYNIISN